MSRDTESAGPHAISVRSGQGRCHGGGSPGVSPKPGPPFCADARTEQINEEHQDECMNTNLSKKKTILVPAARLVRTLSYHITTLSCLSPVTKVTAQGWEGGKSSDLGSSFLLFLFKL